MSRLTNELVENTTSEERKRLRKWMMDTQPKIKAPEKAFHATSLENKDSIDKNGLYAHPVYGELYLCSSLDDCLMFVPKPCIVYEVNAKKLLPKRWRESLDHKKSTYKCKVYCYFGDISSDHIVKFHVIK